MPDDRGGINPPLNGGDIVMGRWLQLPDGMSEKPTEREYQEMASVAGEVACTLDEAEAAERAEWVQAEFLPHLEAVEEIDDGFVQVFPKTDEALEAVVTAVLLESRCCSDESFALEVPADEDEIRLTVTGPEGTKELARRGFFELFEDAPEPT